MGDIYRIVFGLMLILIIFGLIFGVEKKRLEKEAQMELKIKNLYKFLGKEKRYFIMKPHNFYLGHKCTEIDEKDFSYFGLQRVNYRDILPVKTYLKVARLDDDFNIIIEYYLYNKEIKEKEKE